MMLAVELPVEMVETVGPVPPPCTAAGEMLGRLDDLPAGAWLAVVLEGVDVSRLTPWDLPSYRRYQPRNVRPDVAQPQDTPGTESDGR
jgi:hypothetical protein